MNDRTKTLRQRGLTIPAAGLRAVSPHSIIVLHFDGGHIEYWALSSNIAAEITTDPAAEEIWPVLVNGVLIEDITTKVLSDADLKKEFGAQRVEHIVGIGIDE